MDLVALTAGTVCVPVPVTAALATVNDPEINRPVTDLGMVKSVDVLDGGGLTQLGGGQAERLARQCLVEHLSGLGQHRPSFVPYRSREPACSVNHRKQWIRFIALVEQHSCSCR